MEHFLCFCFLAAAALPRWAQSSAACPTVVSAGTLPPARLSWAAGELCGLDAAPLPGTAVGTCPSLFPPVMQSPPGGVTSWCCLGARTGSSGKRRVVSRGAREAKAALLGGAVLALCGEMLPAPRAGLLASAVGVRILAGHRPS